MVCCPTDKMLADFSSKPLQGKAFIFHRNKMQGVNKDDFQMHKKWCKAVLEQYDLWDDVEADLMSLYIKKYGVIDVVKEF